MCTGWPVSSGGPLRRPPRRSTAALDYTVNTATRMEIRSLLATRYLRVEGEALSLTDRLALMKTVTDASEGRDRALRALRLDIKAPRNAWDVVDAIGSSEPQ